MSKAKRKRRLVREAGESVDNQARTAAGPSRPAVWLVYIGLAVLIFSVYSQVCRFPFLRTDDPDYVTENAYARGGLSAEGVRWAFNLGYAGNWHPVTWISHMIDSSVYGVDEGRGLGPGGHHLTSLLLHLAAALLLLLLLNRLTGQLWLNAFIAALFALHPLHVESVAWIAERKDVLSAFFMMLTMLAYVWYVRVPSVARYIAVVVLFALGLMSKQMLVSLPILLLLLDYWLSKMGTVPSEAGGLSPFSRGIPFRKLIIEKIPLLALSFLASAAVFLAQRQSGAMLTSGKVPFAERLANAVVTCVLYLRDMFWPTHLAFYYPFTSVHWQAHEVAACAALLLALTWLAIRLRGYFAVGWFWYLVTLIPVIGLVQVGGQARADRYTYIPSIGIFILVAYGLSDVAGRWAGSTGRKAAAVCALGVVVALSAATYRQVGYWRDSETLYKRAIAVTNDNWFAYQGLASIIQDEAERLNAAGNREEAMRKSQKAMDMLSISIRENPLGADAHNDMGRCLLLLGRTAEAVSEFKRAIELRQSFLSAQTNLANALMATGDTAAAIREYRAGLRINPKYAFLHFNLAVALHRTGDSRAAAEEYRQTLECGPNPLVLYWTLCYLGSIVSSEGDKRQASDLFTRAAQVNKGGAIDSSDTAGRSLRGLSDGR